jgi:hypothetical protein
MPYVFGMPEYLRAADMGAAVNGTWLNCKHATIVTFTVKWASPEPRTIVVTDEDTVDVSEETWTFANGNFTAADVGGSFTIEGTTGGLNDGTFEIASVTDATTVVSVETPGGSDETFAGTETLTLQQLDPTGAFGAQGSNDGPVATESGGQEPSGEVGPVPITVTVDPGDPAEDEGVAEVKLAVPVGYGWVQLTYAATTGGGILDAAAMAKAY